VGSLTGDFDVVLVLALPAANRILAAQHRVQTPEQIYLHSFATRVDEVAEAPPKPRPIGREGGPRPGRTVVRGFAEVQVSTPTLTIPADLEGSRVTAHFGIHARFVADPASTPMPEFMHGELRLTAAVDQIPVESGDLFDVSLTGPDVELSFIPDPGLPLPEPQMRLVMDVLRNFLRSQVGPVNERMQSLGDGGAFSVRSAWFKTMPLAHPALALLLKLEEGEGSPASVSRDLLRDTDDFAIAVDADTLIVRATAALPAAGTTWSIPLGPLRYDLRLDDLSVALAAGAIVVTVRGTARGPIGFTFVARQSVGLRVTPHDVYPQPVGLPSLEIDAGVATWAFSLVRGRIVAELAGRIGALPFESVLSSDQLEAVLRDLRVPLVSVSFVGPADIESDGVAVHGEIDVGGWDAPIARFTRAEDDGRIDLDALESWIPGGTITRFTWTGNTAGAVRRESDEHRFVKSMRAGDGASAPTQWCLEIEGTQMTRSGARATVRSTHCRIDSPILARIKSVELESLWLVVTGPGDPAQPIRAHVRPWFPRTATAQSRANVLVHRNATPSDLATLREALETDTRKGGTTFALVSLAAGATEIGPELLPVELPFAVVDDRSGSSNEEQLATTYLFGFELGEVVWKGSGQLDPKTLAAALAEHAVHDGYLVREHLRLAVAEGEQAPDFELPYAGGRHTALRKLRGQQVLLTFWATWSSPSCAELQRLETRAKQDEGRTLFVAVCEEEASDDVQRFLEEQKLDLFAVADPDGQIARLYGVTCLPTTISIDANGLIRGVQFGLST
jgi:peroxiredoxin